MLYDGCSGLAIQRPRGHWAGLHSQTRARAVHCRTRFCHNFSNPILSQFLKPGFVTISQTGFCHNFSNQVLSQFVTILVHAEPSIVKEDFRSPSELTRPGLNTFSRSESTTPQILNCLKFPQKRDLPSGAIYHPYHLVVMWTEGSGTEMNGRVTMCVQTLQCLDPEQKLWNMPIAPVSAAHNFQFRFCQL